MKKAVAYIRVSSEGQGEDGYSLSDQIQKIKAYALANNIDLDTKNIFKDIESGSNPNRIGLNQLKESVLIKENEITHVLVYAIDRWTRDAVNGLTLLKEFNKKNIKLLSVSESFDPTTAMGKFMCGMLHQMAELNKNTIIEKLTSGKKQMIQKTGKWAGGISPYGYEPVGKRKKRCEEAIINGRGQLKIEKNESKIVSMICFLRKKNYSYDAICEELTKKNIYNRCGRPFNKATIYRIVNREDVYRGTKHINKTITLDESVKPQQPNIL